MRKKSSLLATLLASGLLSSPFLAYAQSTSGTQQTLKNVITSIIGYFGIILDLLMGFAVVMFVFYVIRYFIQPSGDARTEGAKYVMWSLIGFFVILSMWGLVNILLATFNFGQNTPTSWSTYFNIFPQ